jgi:hypothetical protein
MENNVIQVNFDPEFFYYIYQHFMVHGKENTENILRNNFGLSESVVTVSINTALRKFHKLK